MYFELQLHSIEIAKTCFLSKHAFSHPPSKSAVESSVFLALMGGFVSDSKGPEWGGMRWGWGLWRREGARGLLSEALRYVVISVT